MHFIQGTETYRFWSGPIITILFKIHENNQQIKESNTMTEIRT